MRKRYSTEYLVELIGDTGLEGNAYSKRLLDVEVPGARQRVERAVKSLKKALDEIQEVFPDAGYYTGSACFCLLLGGSHSDRGGRDLVANTELNVPLNAPMLDFGGGDW